MGGVKSLSGVKSRWGKVIGGVKSRWGKVMGGVKSRWGIIGWGKIKGGVKPRWGIIGWGIVGGTVLSTSINDSTVFAFSIGLTANTGTPHNFSRKISMWLCGWGGG